MPSFCASPYQIGLRVVLSLLMMLTCMQSLAQAENDCDLARALGGEQAYRECIRRHKAGLSDQSEKPAVSTRNSANQLEALSPQKIYKRITPSVYMVIAANSVREFKRGENLSQGSAIAISDKILLTAYHVVEDCRVIVLCQNEKFYRTHIVKAEPSSDRCILEVKEHSLMPVAAIRPFESIEIGEKVYTIGAPRGLEQTIADGIISGKREVSGIKLLQTTAPVSPGSSGGGLFDEYGRLLGIASFYLSDSQALNFAISAENFIP